MIEEQIVVEEQILIQETIYNEKNHNTTTDLESVIVLGEGSK